MHSVSASELIGPSLLMTNGVRAYARPPMSRVVGVPRFMRRASARIPRKATTSKPLCHSRWTIHIGTPMA
jgi:hypothetical protein